MAWPRSQCDDIRAVRTAKVKMAFEEAK